MFENIKEKETREGINDYEYTCQTIIAFINIVAYNLNGTCYQGETLRTSSANEIQPNTDITPDIRIEVPSSLKTAEYRAINEIKVDLPLNKDFWLETARQLKKYDDELGGWSSNSTIPHDVMFTTNSFRVVGFSDYLNELETKNTISFQRNFSILESIPQNYENYFIFVRKHIGTISNTVLDEKLRHGTGVNHILIINEINQMKFCDSEPPVIYTMMVIWTHIVKIFAERVRFREMNRHRVIPIVFNIEDIRQRLTRFSPSNNPRTIRREWVVKALRGFVELGLASVIEDEVSYEFYFKKHKGSTLEFFFKIIKGEETKPSEDSKLDQYIED